MASSLEGGVGFTAACVQLCSGRNEDANIEICCHLVDEAALQGANFIMTPEMTALMERDRDALYVALAPEEASRSLEVFRERARHHGVWLLVGSLAIKNEAGRACNRSFLVTPEGDIAARYDKIHMFDVNLENSGVYRESNSYDAGDKAVISALPWGRVGMTVCYDVRFPGLYRMLAQAGADFLSVPSAFTEETGKVHWHILLRARAIETGCYVFAPAQAGLHEDGRRTYGHSLIVGPWGDIIAEAEDENGVQAPCVITARIDPEEVIKARTRIPSLRHDRPISAP
ncbi:MAG: carbon-nitrogen hydrolase family protein [Parvularculales bacterium]